MNAETFSNVSSLRRCAAQPAGQRRQQYQHQHHRQVFHHQPANRDAAVQRIQLAAAFQRAQQYHRAGHRQRQTKYQRRAEAPAPIMRDSGTQRGGHRNLQHRTGQRNLAHFQQIIQRKMQANAKHQQHHANFGQLAGYLGIGNKTRGKRTNQNAGQQIADQRWQFQAIRQQAKQQGQAKTGSESGNQRNVMVQIRAPGNTRKTSGGQRTAQKVLRGSL